MKVNKYVLNSCITALILAIALVIFYIVIKVGGPKKNTPKKEVNEPQTSEQITISFDSNGGTAAKEIKINKGESIGLPVVTREGYDFAGWYLNDTKVSNKTQFIKDTKLKAKWTEKKEEIKTFKVTFKSDNTTYKTLTVDCDTELKLPVAPTKEGYNFISWVDKNERPILEDALLACEDITLYANFEKKEEIKKFKVIFYNDTTEFSSVEVECGKGLILPSSTPTKDGFEFVSWMDQNNKTIHEGALFTCDNDVKLYAYFKEKEKEEPTEDKKDENNNESEDDKKD